MNEIIKDFIIIIAAIVGFILSELKGYLDRKRFKNQNIENMQNKRHLMLCKLKYDLQNHLRKIDVSSTIDEIVAANIESEIKALLTLVENYDVSELLPKSQIMYYEFLERINQSSSNMLEYETLRDEQGLDIGVKVHINLAGINKYITETKGIIESIESEINK